MDGQKGILVAESESIVASDLKSLIRKWGYGEAAIAKSEKITFEIASHEMLNVAIVDEGLHGSHSGEMTANRIHQEYKIPVIFLSTWDGNRMVQGKNIDDTFIHLNKPFQQDKLQHLLRKILKPNKN